VLDPVGVDLRGEDGGIALVAQDRERGAAVEPLQLEAVVVVAEGKALLLQLPGHFRRLPGEASIPLRRAVRLRQAPHRHVVAAQRSVLGDDGRNIVTQALEADVGGGDDQAGRVQDLLEIPRLDRPERRKLHGAVAHLRHARQCPRDLLRRLQKVAQRVELRRDRGLGHHASSYTWR
jgi:hypothetical protein